MLKDPAVQNLTEKMRKSFQIILVGNSKKHLEWQEKALRRILDETGGRIVEECEDLAIKELTFMWLMLQELELFCWGLSERVRFHRLPQSFDTALEEKHRR